MLRLARRGFEVAMIDKCLALRLVRGQPWHHDFEVVPGVRTGGTYDPGPLWAELELPADLAGLSVADVGASNGYFSFEARKRGACVAAFDFRHKDNSGFALAQHINGLTDIQHHQVNVLNLRPEAFGQFDIVLALGLLYHTPDPYCALANSAALCRRRLLIESYCIDDLLPEDVRHQPIMRFMTDPERFPQYDPANRDRSNYWGFTSVCLQRMAEDVGFEVRRERLQADRVLLDCERAVADDRLTRIGIAYGTLPVTPVGHDRNDPEAWRLF